ncbi:MAG TPA: hypothetical protein VEA99_04585 [Gemmatimonadaceae bacterium]|nr:hypothetical protein [Gemmatimonadaceae bacterium]
MVTFRIPWETGDWLRHAAEQKKVSINEHVVGLLTDLRTWFGLPFTVTDELESDRKALGLERRDYLVHLLLQRYASIRERGPGFDGPRDRKGTKA